MKIRNYCLVIIGATDGVEQNLATFCEVGPHTIKGGGLLVATFSTALEAAEISNLFINLGSSFFLLDLNSNNNGFNIAKPDIHEGLFGFLKTVKLEDQTDELIRQINMSSDTKTPRNFVRETPTNKNKRKPLTEEDVNKLSKYEKDELWNKIVDNGVEKMTEYDKILLQILSK